MLARKMLSVGLSAACTINLWACRAASEQMAHKPDNVETSLLTRWRQQHQADCISLQSNEHNPPQRVVALLATRQILERSTIYRNTAQAIAPRDVWLCSEKVVPKMGDAYAKFLTQQDVLVINTQRDRNGQVVDAAHEIRHAWQKQVAPEFQYVASNNFVTMQRVFAAEADAEAFSKAVTWELRQHGNPGPWNIGLKEKSYNQVAGAYQAAFEQNSAKGPTQALMMAMRAGFNAWTHQERLRGNYYKAVWQMDTPCVLGSGPALSPYFTSVPGIADEYLGQQDLDYLAQVIPADAARIAKVSAISPNLSPQERKRWNQSYTCRKPAPGQS